MASIHKGKRTGKWLIMFRWDGQLFRKSCYIAVESEARHIKSRVENTIHLLKLGRIEMPPDADAGVWIMTDGKRARKNTHNGEHLARIGEICDAYLPDQQSKQSNTIRTERTHITHLKYVLGERKRMNNLGFADIQRYVNERHKTKFGGNVIEGETIRRELTTFRQIWNWAKKRHYVSKDCPLYDEDRNWAVNIPKSKEKPKFQTWAQRTRSAWLC